MSTVRLRWPDGQSSTAAAGCSWLEAAQAAGVSIPTGCLGGSCGACEIEVNGELVRACLAARGTEFLDDLYWRLSRLTPPGHPLEDDVSAALVEYDGP